ncbi:hypothetical protein ACCO45_006250 [Purpureocillium lilacinum]|uniref:Uncharacterized protein n=1 Tax=Purpureocillium lilacinum TaxID=33203 RepID=A0ACC4E0R7_PURLI
MKVTLTAAVLFLGLASALPAEDLIELDDRAEPSNAPIDWDGPNQSASIKCGKNTYDGHDVYLAAQHGVNLGLLSPPETRGEKKFPMLSTTTTARAGVPLVKNGPYNGGKNNKKYGDERVVFYYDGKAQGVDGHPLVYYCGLMTHDGAAKGGFIQCPDGK